MLIFHLGDTVKAQKGKQLWKEISPALCTFAGSLEFL